MGHSVNLTRTTAVSAFVARHIFGWLSIASANWFTLHSTGAPLVPTHTARQSRASGEADTSCSEQDHG
jgi:hypothetical protein